MFFIRQGATHKVVLGPAVAVGDGFTPVTNLDVATSDEAEAILHDNGTVVDISGYTWAAIATADGYYHLTLHNDISGTVGHLTIVVNDDSLCLPLRADFTVLEEAAYDAMFKAAAAGPALASDVTTAHSTTDGKIDALNDFDGTGATLHSDYDAAKTAAQAGDEMLADVTKIHGSALTEGTSGYLAAAFVKLFDVASPVLVASDVMRGTDSANTTTPDAAGVVATALGDGTVVLAGTYDAAKTAAQAGDQMNLAADAITAAKIADDAFAAEHFAADALVAATFATDSITADAVAADAVAEVKTAIEAGGSHLTLIKAVTDALTAAAAAKLALSAAGIVSGAAEAGTLSITQMTTDLAEATDDHYIGAVVVWTSGVLAGQRSDITDYAGANGLLTFTAVTEAASAGDTFVII